MFTAPLQRLRQLILQFSDANIAGVQPLLPHISLMATSEATASYPHVCEPTFALVVQGVASTALGDRVFDCSAGQCFILPVDLPIDARIRQASKTSPFLGFRLRLKPESIAALLLEAPSGAWALAGVPAIAVEDASADVIEAVVRLVALLERPGDIPVLGAALERELLWRLVNSRQGGAVRHIGNSDGKLVRVGRAIRMIRRESTQRLPIETLASEAGMSVTAFHRHFRAITTMSPGQYQQQVRLQAARARLLALDEDVAAVAYASGYCNPSQFSREYRRLFGAAPGEHRKRLRELMTDVEH